MSKMYKLLLAVFAVGISFTVSAQENYWTSRSNNSGITTDKAVARQSFPKEFKLFSLNIEPLRQKLFSAVDSRGSSSVIISLPNADGNMEQFQVFEASNFEPALQARFPEIRAFSGKGITDNSAILKLSISPQGVQTMVFRTNSPNEYLEPYSQDHTVYAAFKSQRNKGALPWVCSAPDQQLAQSLNENISFLRPESSAGQLKTMRLAQSCNAEYSNYFGATSSAQVALVLAAFNATLTRCNGCYEKDLAIHLNLIANTDQVIYYNPATDPYTTMGNWNSQLQATLTAVIGEANYDIGHMFGASGGGGNAGCIGCVCVNGQKGSGITSPADGIPQGDNFDIDYVAHEVGHQMGGNHTFSMSNEGYGVNKEVGSGITIMGYAGITAQDVAPHSIDIFHEASIQQIQVNMVGKTCPVTTNLAGVNATPVVAALTNYTIPISTPFALTGSATDTDPGDVLTYCWEQNDDGAGQTGANSVARENKPSGPNWITWPATTTPTRLFPRLSTILTGANITGPLSGGDAGANIEALSSVGRTLNFRLTVRDNRPYNGTAVGQTNYQDMAVTVNAAGGPFLITTQNTATNWEAGSSQTISWSVNNTTAAPFNCANVKISLSTDGGNTFPVVLASSTANDGTETITVPSNLTTTGRIKVEAIGNIFFDINNANITIVAGYNFSSPSPFVAGCPTPASMDITLATTAFGGFTTPIVLTATGNPAGTTVTFTPSTINPGSSTVVTLGNTAALANGDYLITVTGTAGTYIKTVVLTYRVTAGGTPNFTSQPGASVVCDGGSATFTAGVTALSYQWQVNTGTAWANLTNTAPYSGVTTPSLSISAATYAMNGYQYRIVATNCTVSINSNAATLTVATPAVISAHPQNVAVCEGAGASFSVTATTLAGALTYQWQLSTNGGTSWTNITNATAATYTQTSVPVGQNGYRFRVIVTAGCGSVTSNVGILTVNTYPVITFGDIPSTICVSDGTVGLTASPAGGTWSGSGVSGSIFTPSAAGVGAKTLSYSVANAGCTSNQTKVISVLECPERHRLLTDYLAVFVYPVPNNGNFSIRMNTDLYKRIGVRVFGADGRMYHSQVVEGIGYGSVIPVDLSRLASGTYSLHLYNDEKDFIFKGVNVVIFK